MESSSSSPASSSSPPSPLSESEEITPPQPWFVMMVQDGEWDDAIYNLQHQHWELTDEIQVMVLRELALNKAGPQFRSVSTLRHLLRIGFPMTYLDVSLDHAIQQGDWDLVAELCDFSLDALRPRHFPDRLPLGVKCKMSLVLQSYPGTEHYLERTVQSIFTPDPQGHLHYTYEEAESAVHHVDLLPDPVRRGQVLMALLTEHDVLNTLMTNLDSLAPQRVLRLVDGIVGGLLRESIVTAGNGNYRVYVLLEWLTWSGLLNTDQHQGANAMIEAYQMKLQLQQEMFSNYQGILIQYWQGFLPPNQ